MPRTFGRQIVRSRNRILEVRDSSSRLRFYGTFAGVGGEVWLPIGLRSVQTTWVTRAVIVQSRI